MNESIPQDRSPRSPVLPLAECIVLTSKLFDAIRTAIVGPEIAVKPLGYGSTNGAAMTTVATLAQYGLIDRTNGKVSVTPLAVRILHPKSESQKEEAIREAALTPKVMRELFEGYLECSEEVIKGHLIQSGFNSDRARRIAAIHIDNRAFAKLAQPQISSDEGEDSPVTGPEKNNAIAQNAPIPSIKQQSLEPNPAMAVPISVNSGLKTLAQYTIPLGGNQATLVFMGEKLTSDDFDALIDFVEFTKRQFERAQKSIQTSTPQISSSDSE